MDEQQANSLLKRVEQLEAEVRELRYAMWQLTAAWQAPPLQTQPPDQAALSQSAPAPAPAIPPPPPPPIAASALPLVIQAGQQDTTQVGFPTNFDAMRSGGWWLNKAGIALLLFGLAFLFKYAVDRGWLTEEVRIGFGLALGSVLLGAGMRLHRKYRNFSQVLLGGSIATYYITGYAAYQLYHLVDYGVAFAFMVLVTLLAFFLAIRLDGVVLSLIGAAGGLATPFLLYTDTRSIPGLLGYTCLVIAGTSAIFFYKAWYSLLWTSFVGGWWVLVVAYVSGINATIDDNDRWALQGAAAFYLLAFWALAVMREILSVRNPAKWRRQGGWWLEQLLDASNPWHVSLSVHLLAIVTPLLAITFSPVIWESLVSQRTWGWVALGGAIMYAAVALSLQHLTRQLAHVHAFMAAGILALALTLLLENGTNDALFFALAAEAAGLLLVSRWLLPESISAAARLLFLGIGLWFLQRITRGNDAQTAILNTKALADLAVMGLILLASFLVRQRQEVLVYRLAVHIAFLGWLWRELSILHDGRAYTTVAWGAYAMALLIAGIVYKRNQVLLNTAIATLFLVVAKLFLVDLTLDEVWRFLLFLGFGGLFLIISYYFQVVLKQTPKAADEPK